MGVVKEGYKATELGVIPEDWEVKTLPTVFSYIHGKAHEPLVDEFGSYILVNSKFISTDGAVQKNVTQTLCTARVGDILTVLSDLPNGRALAKTFHVELPSLYAVNQRICILRTKTGDSLFFNYIMNRNKFFLSLDDGVSQTHILNHHIEKCPVLVPPTLEEQKAIATALSDVDELIESLERLIEKKKAIKQGMMQELLSGKTRFQEHVQQDGYKETELGVIPEDWVIVGMGRIGSCFSGLSGKGKKDFENGNARFITFLNVINNTVVDLTSLDFVKINSDEKQNLIFPGDLLFNTSSETPEEVGMCAILLEYVDALYLNSFCFGFRIEDDKNHFGLYLSYFFNSSIGRKFFRSLAQGATRYNLSKKNFKSIVIAIPTLEEQKAIATALSDVDEDIQSLEEKRSKYQAIKQGMMQELLTGKTRLI